MDARHARRVVARVGVVQIDSVNVLVRSHELPLFSRLGPYPRDLLPRLAYGRHRELFEYWAHQASYVPVALHPLLRWRMEQAHGEAWGRMIRIQRDHPGLVQAVLAEVADRGPLAASELSVGGRGTGSWWGWGDGKTAIEWLFWSGEVAAVGRRGNFERVYDLAARAFPPEILALQTPPEDDAKRELVRFAAARLGIGTAKDIADYFRLRLAETRLRLAELTEQGAVVPVRVESWAEQAFLSADASVPARAVVARALLSPFDSLVWAAVLHTGIVESLAELFPAVSRGGDRDVLHGPDGLDSGLESEAREVEEAQQSLVAEVEEEVRRAFVVTIFDQFDEGKSE